ncbi:MAG: cation:proton antiporter [Thermoplasmataceae archaeon]|jgi:Kef-type K+ transport system membrane component KefB|nr:MAG: Sodium/hydrogen exchanger [Thermoplasmatales archaeon E-plasma]MCL4348266.1 cation:proton antiporter [Candidatus Thermoplasmatota archaeon]MCL5787105.1 cation:proton antiporter [Candidatus Thermoplasmatota archaeon]
MDIITEVLIILALSIVIGEIMESRGFPNVVAAMIVGIILGPAVLNYISPNPVLAGISDISLFFIVLLIGVEVTTELLTKYNKTSTSLSVGSFGIPFLLMIAFSVLIYNLQIKEAIILSLSISIPSISIVSVLLLRYNLLSREGGMRILASVVISDVLAFIILSSLINTSEIYFKLIAITVFIFLLLLLDRYMRKNGERSKLFFEKLRAKDRGEQLIFAAIIIWGLFVSRIFEELGFTFILGALFSGMIINDVVIGPELIGIIKRTLTRINDSFFIPIFFTIAGLGVVIPPEKYYGLLLGMVIITVVAGGLLNFLTSRIFLTDLKSTTTMAILGGRGAVGVIIATFALSEGLITNNIYSIAIVGTIMVSLIMPPLISKEDRKTIVVN